ncbi:hypothetical protein I3842_10G103000 [Carya illinoinensis]|uniref:Retrovirus-related Pol polyprotein from transposon TNT 1-94 n=1 Tax=Carya illinoinensis TaxID=32201 RepID=A0A922J2S1_CARIL|nr:hypothetical protein I3842_10G103000 [Carya illinoinensis]
MGITKFDVEKFTGENNFGLWRIKMRALLDGKVDVQRDILQKAHSVLILSLGDNVLREVASEETAAGIWLKLEHLSI